MSLDNKAADHACQVVRRQVQEEFPDLTLLFIVHQPGQRPKALDTKRGEIYNHPAGEAFWDALKKDAASSSREDKFSGIAIGKEKKLFGLKTQEKMLACCFVNAANLENPDDARRQALFLAWHALYMINNLKKKKSKSEPMVVNLPKQDPAVVSWKNMLADAFSALMLEMEGRRDSVGKLARQRSLMALTPKAGAVPEKYPFPLVLDATRLVYQDLAQNNPPGKTASIDKALQMTREIAETFDRTAVDQWWAFTKIAQEMAWSNADHNTILGAAAYSSDDAYARATAYLVAEGLNIQTLKPLTGTQYNPFAEIDVNERHHIKVCEEVFQTAVAQAAMNGDSWSFIQSAQLQNQKLLNGDPIGWCAYPLLLAEDTYKNSGSSEEAKKTFDTGMGYASWKHVDTIATLITKMRRKGTNLTPEMLAEKLEQDEELQFLAGCFRISAT